MSNECVLCHGSKSTKFEVDGKLKSEPCPNCSGEYIYMNSNKLNTLLSGASELVEVINVKACKSDRCKSCLQDPLDSLVNTIEGLREFGSPHCHTSKKSSTVHMSYIPPNASNQNQKAA